MCRAQHRKDLRKCLTLELCMLIGRRWFTCPGANCSQNQAEGGIAVNGNGKRRVDGGVGLLRLLVDYAKEAAKNGVN